MSTNLGQIAPGGVRIDVGNGVASPVTSANPLPVRDTTFTSSYLLDAFGRLRSCQPLNLFEVTFEYTIATRRMGLQRNDAGTTATHVTPVVELAVPATSGRGIVFQSHRYHQYQPGKSQLIRMTGYLGDGTFVAGMGYGDDSDGIFLERASTGLQIRFRSSTVPDQLIPQSQWNIDKLDGTGSSGITVALNMAHHVVIDLQWLGVGRIRVGIVEDGRVILVHQFDFAMQVSLPYTRTATLPIRWYAESTGAAGVAKAICACVTSEGGHPIDPRLLSYASLTSKEIGAAGVRTPLVSLRPKAVFGGIANHLQIIPESARVLLTAADNVLVEIVRDGTLTGATFAISEVDSAAEVDVAATAITGGRVVWCDFISQSSRDLETHDMAEWPLTIKANGADRDILTLCFTRIAGAASAFYGINWGESR